jgi:F-type H+-transporting ATPase subunit b
MDQLTEVLGKFGVNWASFIAALINFTVLLIILNKFAYKPLLQVLDERRRKIAESVKQSEQIKEELAKTQAARDAIFMKANDEAQRIINEAKLAAEKFRDSKLNEALQSAQDTLRKAQEAGNQERQRMLADLRREMVALVVATTAKVTGKILTAEDQKRLSDETLKELAA